MPPTRNHYLRPNEGKEAPSRWFFIDCETETQSLPPGDELLTLKLACGIYWERGRRSHPERVEQLTWDNPRSVVAAITERAPVRARLVVVAHNAQFDVQALGLLPALAAQGWTVQTFVADYRRFIVSLRKDTATILLLDSMNWFPFSLAEVAMSLGTKKFDYPGPDASPEALLLYCTQDVTILYRAVRRWVEHVKERDYGVFATTLAGQAWNAYRHRFMPAPLVVDTDARRVSLARASYHGGRCECFHLGQLPPQRYTLVDVNSLYPSVMRTNVYPVEPLRYKEWRTPPYPPLLEEPHHCVAEVTLDTEVPYYPLKRNGHLVFPVGTFRTVLAGPELYQAYINDHIVAVHRAVKYRCVPIFDAYVDHFYGERLRYTAAGDTVGATISKLLLNNLYGKFGQRAPVYERVDGPAEQPFGSWEHWDCDEHRWRRYQAIGGVQYEERGRREGANSIPGIAAFVASYARVELVRLIELAGWQHVYYVDTDSLLVDDTGLTHLSWHLARGTLGRLKEVWSSDDVTIYGPKAYRHGTEIKIRGIPKQSQTLPDGSFLAPEYKGLVQSWRNGVMEGVWRRYVTKHLRAEYTKGVPQPDGSVLPLRIPSGT